MTKGKPLKLILAFCIPALLGNMVQQFYNIIDSIIVGRYIGVDALAGVGATSSLTFLVIGFVIGLCTGFSIHVAQSFGAGDYKKMRKYAANALYLCGIFSVVLTVITMLGTRWLLVTMQTPEDIMQEAYDFIIVIFAGITVTMLYNILASIIRAVGDSRTPLVFLIISAVLNIILDFVFILGMKKGVASAAVATVISQMVSGVLCIIYIKKKYFILHFEKDETKLDIGLCKELLAIGLPMAFQFSITAIGSVILQWAVNSLGSVAVAAVTAASKIQLLAIQPMETLGLTLATYGGQNLGAKQYERIKKGVNQAIIIGLAYSVFIYGFMELAGEKMTLLFIAKDSLERGEILEQSKIFLRLNGLFYMFLSVLFILRNTLQGLGYSILPMMAGVSELVARTLVSVLFVGKYGYEAACLASPVAWIFADVLLITTYVLKQKDIKRTCGYNKEKISKKRCEANISA